MIFRTKVFLPHIRRSLLFACCLLISVCTNVVDAKIVFRIINDLFVMNDDGSSRRRLTKNTQTKDAMPRWSPDGKKIAFVRYMDKKRQNTSELFIMNADGTNLRQLTHNNVFDDYPSWAPDGKHLTFSSERSGDVEVHVIEVDTLKVTQLTGVDGDEAGSTTSDWSPDGTEIVYEKFKRNGAGFSSKNLYAMSANGEKKRVLIPEQPFRDDAEIVMRFEPRWSSDGKRILFVDCTWDKNGMRCRLSILRLNGRVQVIDDIYDRLGNNLLIAGSCWMDNDRAIIFSMKNIEKPNTNYDLYLYVFETQSLRRLTREEAKEGYPDWVEGTLPVSPQGKLTTQWGNIKQSISE